MKLIDKDALVAEIERRKELVDDPIILDNDLIIGERNTYIRLLSFINTLEVKEVDLESEFNSFLDNKEGHPRMWHSDEQIEWAKNIAKHFFELGLKAQKGEEV